MFRLGEQSGLVTRRPHIALLAERNTRTGFFEPDQYQAVRAHLPEALRSVFDVAYTTGWRVRDEILTRQWHHIDLRAGWLRLEPGQTKNAEGRQFPLTAELRAVMEAQRARTTALEHATGAIIPWVFHRDGQPIKSYRRAWITACTRAGVPGRLPHAFRRTAVRNLERSGVSRSASMALVGHKTESIYRRYAIVAESDLREAGTKLEGAMARRGSTREPLGVRDMQRVVPREVREKVVGRDGIEPPTPGFSVLFLECA
jgi:integrase